MNRQQIDIFNLKRNMNYSKLIDSYNTSNNYIIQKNKLQEICNSNETKVEDDQSIQSPKEMLEFNNELIKSNLNN